MGNSASQKQAENTEPLLSAGADDNVSHPLNAGDASRKSDDVSEVLRRVSQSLDLLHEDVDELETPPKKLSQMSPAELCIAVTRAFVKLCLLLGTLYFFIFALQLMGESFKLLSGRAQGNLFSFVNNPIAGLAVGTLVTVLVQSSSTSTSIIVGLVGSGNANSLTVRQAIPIIFGCNIGTSVTPTLVSFVHASKPEEFGPAFSAATINFFFNFLATAVLLPIEVAFHFLELTSKAITESMTGGKSATFDSPINAAVSPFVDVFLKVNSTRIQEISTGVDVTGSLIEGGVFRDTISDIAVGVILMILSIFLLIVSLMGLVKLLASFLKGTASKWIQNGLGANVYLAMLIGLAATVTVQSSSITTSTLVPLCGLGIVTLTQMFPFCLGANIGTTITPILASLATSVVAALQIAFVHLLFNIFGIVIWFPIPFMRQVSLKCAEKLGKRVAYSKYLATLYLVSTFLFIPIVLLALSAAGTGAAIAGVVLLALGICSFFLYYWALDNHIGILNRFLPCCNHVKRRSDSIGEIALLTIPQGDREYSPMVDAENGSGNGDETDMRNVHANGTDSTDASPVGSPNVEMP